MCEPSGSNGIFSCVQTRPVYLLPGSRMLGISGKYSNLYTGCIIIYPLGISYHAPSLICKVLEEICLVISPLIVTNSIIDRNSFNKNKCPSLYIICSATYIYFTCTGNYS